MTLKDEGRISIAEVGYVEQVLVLLSAQWPVHETLPHYPCSHFIPRSSCAGFGESCCSGSVQGCEMQLGGDVASFQYLESRVHDVGVTFSDRTAFLIGTCRYSVTSPTHPHPACWNEHKYLICSIFQDQVLVEVP